jgi:hypothetical protein
MTSSTTAPLSTGIKVLVGFLIIHALLLVTQTWAVWDYDLMASWKLQEPRSMATEAVVQSNRAIGLADTVIMLPLSVMAIVGLLRRQFYGVVCSWMLLGIALYWPVVFVMSRFTFASADIAHVPLRTEDLVITGTIFLFAAWGGWLLCRSPELIDWWKVDFPTTTRRRRGEGTTTTTAMGEETPLVARH